MLVYITVYTLSVGTGVLGSRLREENFKFQPCVKQHPSLFQSVEIQRQFCNLLEILCTHSQNIKMLSLIKVF